MCIFCQLANNDSKKIYADKDIYAIFDKSQSYFGHILVIPKKHYENILEIPKKIHNKLTNMAILIGKIEKNIFNANGIKILINTGKEADQTIMHCHIHVIPYNLVKKENYSNNKNLKRKIIANITNKINQFIKKIN
ncbi:MAG: HIT family protein [Bacilli bacterium]|nr:HIT family protein [Bacilli bacterium]